MRKHGIFVPAVGCVEAGNVVLNDLSGPFIREIKNSQPRADTGPGLTKRISLGNGAC
jgi:hypothetical protein